VRSEFDDVLARQVAADNLTVMRIRSRRRSLVPLRGDHRLQHLAFMVDGASKELAVDLHERLT
jgi:hypothetical protein